MDDGEIDKDVTTTSQETLPDVINSPSAKPDKDCNTILVHQSGVARNDVSLNKAYLASNSAKKKKTPTRVDSVLNVISLVDSKEVDVVPHTMDQRFDKHTTILIVEKQMHNVGSTGGKIMKTKGLAGLVLNDIHRSLQLKKPTVVRLNAHVIVSDWVKKLAQKITEMDTTGNTSTYVSNVGSNPINPVVHVNEGDLDAAALAQTNKALVQD
ncbi:hypothetical protein V6N13_020204 [Hibiscus sabdariffa]